MKSAFEFSHPPKPAVSLTFVLMLSVIVAGALATAADTKSAATVTSGSDTAVNTIRQEVQKIEKEASKFRRVTKPWMDQSTEGGDVVGLFQGQDLRKAVEDLFGETGRSITEFYFQSNRLIFAVTTHIEYEHPYSFNEKSKDWKIARRTQERCYFAQNRLANILDSNGKPMPLNSERAQILAKELPATARQIAATLASTNQPSAEKGLPLDHKVQALLVNTKGTADEAFAASMATQLWDDELNRLYGELRRKLDANSMKELQVAQQKWITWRDAEFKVTDSLYGRQHGTMYVPFCEHHKMDIVRSRALDLQHWLELQENYLAEKKENDALDQDLISN